MKKSSLLVSTFLIIAIALVGCSTSELLNSQNNIFFPSLNDTPTPTLIPTDIPVSIPIISEELLKSIFRHLIISVITTDYVCSLVLDTAEKLQSGEINGFDAEFEIIFEALLIDEVDVSISEGEHHYLAADLVERLGEHVNIIKEVLGALFNSEISSADVPGLLQDECASIVETQEAITALADAFDLSEEARVEIIDDFREYLGILVDGLQTPVSTPEFPDF